jgi:hypothetical protein
VADALSMVRRALLHRLLAGYQWFSRRLWSRLCKLPQPELHTYQIMQFFRKSQREQGQACRQGVSLSQDPVACGSNQDGATANWLLLK